MHTKLGLAERCELSLSGFCAMDLFFLLATKKCSDLRLPRGSMFMASQTMANLQSIALTVATMTLSKPASFVPWAHGSARLTEASIEQWFGLLRKQTANSLLSTRQFFFASARQSLRHSKLLNKMRAGPKLEERKLSEEEFLV